MMSVRTSERLVVFGKTGSGKSVLARAVFESIPPPRMVIDPKDDIGATGGSYAVTFRDPTRIPAEPVVRFVPRDPFDRDTYDRLYQSVWVDPVRRFVWLDEGEIVAPSGKGMPPAMARHIVQGRAKGLGHLTLNQRPVGLDPKIVANAEHVVCFSLGYDPDIETMAAAASSPAADMRRWLASLDRYGFAWLDRGTGRFMLSGPINTRGNAS